MTSEQPSEQELAVYHQYLSVANDFCDALIDTARRNDGAGAADLAVQLHRNPDTSLLMMVLGQMTARLLNAQRKAEQPHGPLMTAEEMGYDIPAPETWHVAIHDQAQAAAADHDYASVGRIIVDGQLQAMRVDADNGERLDFDRALRAMMLVEHNTLVVIAAEAMLRLMQHDTQGG